MGTNSFGQNRAEENVKIYQWRSLGRWRGLPWWQQSYCRVSYTRVLSRWENNQEQQCGESSAELTLEMGRLVRRSMETIASVSEASLTIEWLWRGRQDIGLCPGYSSRRSYDSNSLWISVSQDMRLGRPPAAQIQLPSNWEPVCMRGKEAGTGAPGNTRKFWERNPKLTQHNSPRK